MKLGIVRTILFQFVMLGIVAVMIGSMATVVSFAQGDTTSLLQMNSIVFGAHKEQQQLLKAQHQEMLVVSQEIIHVKIN